MIESGRALLSDASTDGESALSIFLALWQYLYSHVAKRDSTLGNELLRQRTADFDPSSESKFRVYTIHTAPSLTLQKPDEDAGYDLEVPPPEDWERAGIKGAELIPLLSRDQASKVDHPAWHWERRAVIAAVAMAVFHINRNNGLWERCRNASYGQSSEIIRHFGQRVLKAIVSPYEGDPWEGATPSFRQLENIWAYALDGEDDNRHLPLWSLHVRGRRGGAEVEFDELPPEAKWRIKREWIHHLHLFLLAYGGHGSHFYHIVGPPPARMALRTSFSLGCNRPLRSEELSEILLLCSNVKDRLADDLDREHVNYEFDKLRDLLDEKAYVGLQHRLEAVDQVAATALGRPRPTYKMITGGLHHYLALGETLAEQVTHEGHDIHFDLLVADGVTRYENLETNSSLDFGSPEDTLDKAGQSNWITDQAEHGDEIGARPRANHELVAQLLGNYAFFQRPGAFILGNREGRLLALVNHLEKGATPEFVTRFRDYKVGGGEPNFCGCFLVRIRPGGELQLYYGGELVLWRRLGRYVVVPLGQYGASYRDRLLTSLKSYINEDSDNAHEQISEILNLQALVSTIWSISEARGEGACFVIADLTNEAFIANQAMELTTVLPHAEGLPLAWQDQAEVLRDLAIQDGAVAVCSRTGLVQGRRWLRPASGSNALSSDMIASLSRTHPEILRWGTRHLSSLMLALKMQDTCCLGIVVTVSSDGDVHVFRSAKDQTPEDVIVGELTYRPASLQEVLELQRQQAGAHSP